MGVDDKAIGDMDSKMEAKIAKLRVELKVKMAKNHGEVKSEMAELHAKVGKFNDGIKSLGRDLKRMYRAVLLAYIMYIIWTSN